MTSTNINDLEKPIGDSFENHYCNCNNISPLVATGLVVGSALTTATILSPKIRKVTLPLAKFALKQQIRVLAGLGLLAIVTSMTTSSDDLVDYLQE